MEVLKITKIKHTIIIGVGNLLLGDEGLGVHIVEELNEINLPPNVEFFDGGTGGVSILNLMEGADKVIIVDAVLGGGEPGQIYVVDIDRLLKGVVKFFLFMKWICCLLSGLAKRRVSCLQSWCWLV